MKRLLGTLGLALAMLLPTTVYSQAKQVKRFSHININQDRLVVIKGPIRAQMADEIIRDIYDLSQDNKGAIYYVINTNGGSLMAGNQIIQAMESADAKSICIVDRAAYSMGALILAHCNVAYIHKDASVMFHEGYLRLEGKMSEVISYIDFERREFSQLCSDTAKLLNMSKTDYMAKQKDEWWLTAADTARIGLTKGILLKLAYPMPDPPQLPGFFSIGFEEAWSTEDGAFDLTWYPLQPMH
jgi:ATP-dependent protease ClpP protease subunit